MNNPISIIITDTHLKESNIELVKDIFEQANKICLDRGIEQIFFAGDFFESRKAQSLSVLIAAQEIFESFKYNGIEFIAIPGNHDKSNYDSEDSFLDIFDSQIDLIKDYDCRFYNNLSVHFIPYFSEKSGKYLEYLLQVKLVKTDKNILITHIGINGSISNDNDHISDCVPSDKFKKFNSVLVGHFHNSNYFENIHYIGSAYQANYGEDEHKGFVILYEDGSVEFIQSDFPKFKKVILNLDNFDATKLAELNSKEDNIRIELTGEIEKLKSFDKSFIEDMGIQVILKPLESIISDDTSTNISFDKESLLSSFKTFCEENSVDDVEYGLEKMKNI